MFYIINLIVTIFITSHNIYYVKLIVKIIVVSILAVNHYKCA